MFTKEELEFINQSMSTATVRGEEQMRVVISVIDKCKAELAKTELAKTEEETTNVETV